MEFKLPEAVQEIAEATEKLTEYYKDKVEYINGEKKLTFTLDGKLVGDIGEALAAEHFDIKLSSEAGIDAYIRGQNGKSVQIKATGQKNGGAAFRDTKEHADYLIFFQLDYETLKAKLIYNGPEAPVRETLGEGFKNQKTVNASTLREMNKKVGKKDRVPMKGK